MMVGDRRATAGNLIADPKMRKVFAADDYSAIAIAGAAGQAEELVKLFQLELEHYEKITGDRLSLEGKANRLAQMIRSNFPMALQGLVVVPLFGGFDLRRGEGRIFYYDATGGRWEEDDFQTTGSGGQSAKNSFKKRWRPGLSRDEALRVAVEALIDAAEDDSATGGPDPVRGIWPIAVAVTAEGATDVPEEQVVAAVEAVVAGAERAMSFMPYVAPEQMMKDRSDYAHKGIARGRSVIGLEYAEGLLFIAENPSVTLHKISEIYDRIAFAGVGKYSEFEELRIAGIRLADLRGYQYGREDVKARDLANAYSQALSTIFTQQMKPYEVEVLVGEVDGEAAGTGIYHIMFDGSVSDEHGCVAIGGQSEDLMEALRERYADGWDLATSIRTAVQVLGTTPETARDPGRPDRGRRPGPDEDAAAEVPSAGPRRGRRRPCSEPRSGPFGAAGIPWGPWIDASSASRTSTA